MGTFLFGRAIFQFSIFLTKHDVNLLKLFLFRMNIFTQSRPEVGEDEGGGECMILILTLIVFGTRLSEDIHFEKKQF